MGKQFSIEDGNLGNAPITTSVKRTNSDIDCSFERNPTTNDVYKKAEAAAVRQSIKNLLMTNRGSVPFKPVYGGNLESFLFQLDTEIESYDIEEAVRTQIELFEPRAVLRRVTANIQGDYNSVSLTIVFQVINTSKVVTMELAISRAR
jgi:phage baseplate assembly protein W